MGNVDHQFVSVSELKFTPDQIINLLDRHITLGQIIEAVLNNPNQIFNIDKHQLPFVLMTLYKDYPNNHIDYDYVVTGGGFNFLVIFMQMNQHQHLVIHTLHANVKNKNDQEYRETNIFLYDENDTEMHFWREKCNQGFDAMIPDSINYLCPSVGSHFNETVQVLMMYRNPDPPDWYFD